LPPPPFVFELEPELQPTSTSGAIAIHRTGKIPKRRIVCRYTRASTRWDGADAGRLGCRLIF
jgi:hypothetical protein